MSATNGCFHRRAVNVATPPGLRPTSPINCAALREQGRTLEWPKVVIFNSNDRFRVNHNRGKVFLKNMRKFAGDKTVAGMNIEDFREYCLSLPGAEEKMPFTRMASARSLLIFSVAGKWFCFVDIDAFEFCNLKCDPTESGELAGEYDGIRPGYHMNKRHWISVFFNSDVPDAKIKELVRKSYELIVASLPKRLRAELPY